jgi:hypothetical protein
MKKVITITISVDEATGAVNVISSSKSTKRKRKRVRKTPSYFTDRNGREWPIYETIDGKRYAVRKSRNKSKYKHYLNGGK